MNYVDYEIEEHLNKVEYRKRNLRVAIVKACIENEWKVGRDFKKEEIISSCYFRLWDIKYCLNDFFKTKKETYTLVDAEKQYIQKIIDSHFAVENLADTAIAKFMVLFGTYFGNQVNSGFGRFPYEKYRKISESVKPFIPILHWHFLPIFDKDLLRNRGYNPELEIGEFYDHFDCLKAIYNEIMGQGEKMQVKSDDTINKELVFEVYTRRWGHTDHYRMMRTIDGWKCDYSAIGGDCKKDGEGGLFDNLKHDCVFFPEEGVKYALKELWEDADDGNLSLEELQVRLQQIADWISHVEKAVGEKQPEWVNYY